jgi:multidrug efflux pump subunit AcrA (membrane-fusion protein)
MNRTRTGAVTLAVVVLGAAAFAKWPRSEKVTAAGSTIPTAIVKPASFDVALSVIGVVDAAKAVPVVNEAPRTQIVWMETDGKTVKPGDVIMRLNDAEMKKTVTDQEQQDAQAVDKAKTDVAEGTKRIQNAKAGVEKAKGDLKLAQEQNKAAIEKAQAEIDFMQKEVELAQGQFDKRKQLCSEKLMPLTQLEQAQDELRGKQFGLEKAKRALDQAKTDADATEKVKQLDIRKAEIEQASAESALAQTKAENARSQSVRTLKLDEARDQLAGTVVKVSAAGMLLVEQRWDDGMRPFRVGDEVYEGARLASIIDPAKMRVKCDISEGDIERVKSGQMAVVQVAAIGGRTLHGTVKNIDNLARERGWWEGGTPGKRVFSAMIDLSDGDTRLRPGMGATVQILLEKADTGLAVPIEALFARDGKPYVYHQTSDGYREVPVKIIQRNEMTAAVSGNLKSGDTVACDQPPAGMRAGAKEHHT